MNKPLTVDLNCDLGESFGAYRIGSDELILPFVTSANIACGFHAGDPGVMRKTVQLCLQHNVAIGAHPGLPDLVGFGRRNMAVSAEEVYDMVVYQMGALQAFIQAEGGTLHHVKPHGALYNMAATDTKLAEAIAEAVYKVNPEALLYGLAGSELINAGMRLSLQIANEVFADRTYQQDGTLTSRRQHDALITDRDKATRQVLRMVQEGKVQSQQGVDAGIQADTVCIHGDGTHALEFARHIHETLQREGIALASPTVQRP
ncbi:5-oxoprolinase subunit PxpA [Pontibacter sp. HSC-14F20]|uniref:5-oxoprolinase subunit PxpA n=1 Tax=Pontibacter sp. HSC-14F20 TaxID=2864136 RepID=UPI001C72DA6E|nr:5-oxoprolinase subunit PxpA [Pontibacter sp. HSC-14F20]MBX0333039.1 5-oxoprolinase subunit PxpA [Pontibacter sp. HSC-14F20]